MGGDQIFNGGCLKRHVPGQRMVERASETVHVRQERFRLATDFFRSDVIGSAPDGRFVNACIVGLSLSGQPEINQFGFALVIVENVPRLDVAMQQIVLKRLVQGGCDSDARVQNVMDNPLMGLGLNDWARPDWLADTVDNFWLLTAMQAGLPALAFLVIALVIHVVRIVKVEGLDEQTRDIRTGYLVVLAGTVFTLSTVHVWDAMAVFIMFFIGAGSFLFTSLPEDQKRQAQDIQAIRANFRKIQPEVVRAPVIYTRVHLEQHHTRFVEKAGTRKALSRHIRSGDEVRNPSNS